MNRCAARRVDVGPGRPWPRAEVRYALPGRPQLDHVLVVGRRVADVARAVLDDDPGGAVAQVDRPGGPLDDGPPLTLPLETRLPRDDREHTLLVEACVERLVCLL